MKKNLNIIQIKGFRGILYLAFLGCCFVAGFGWFPGWLCMKLWNYGASFSLQVPAIGIIQGLLLWGIIVSSYFMFRKDKLVVYTKTTDGLSEEELKAVFANVKKQFNDDIFIQNMLKTKEAELRIKRLQETDIPMVKKNKINEEKDTVETK